MPLPAILGAVGRWFAGTAATQAVTSGGKKGKQPRASLSGPTRGQGGSSWLTKLWTLEAFNNLKDRLLDGYSPEFQHTIFVACKGGPKADIGRLWRLVLATAFGKYRNAVPSYQGQQIEATWDISEKIVGVKISYAISGAISNLAVGQGSRGLQFLYKGPSQEIVGGTWPDWLKTPQTVIDEAGGNAARRVIGGVLTPGALTPVGLAAGFNPFGNVAPIPAPTLEDNGRLILTTKKLDPNLQPPRPNSDYLIALVSNMLTSPCYAPAAPPPNGNEDSVKRVPKTFFPPDRDPPKEIVNQAIQMNSGGPVAFAAVAGGAAAAALALGDAKAPDTIDGYPSPKVPVPGIDKIASTYNNPR